MVAKSDRLSLLESGGVVAVVALSRKSLYARGEVFFEEMPPLPPPLPKPVENKSPSPPLNNWACFHQMGVFSMRTAPPRRPDGKFGTGFTELSAEDQGKARRLANLRRGGGRKPGSRNKIKVQMESIKAKAGVPADQLEFLQYVQMNPDNIPEITWDLRTRAASEAARYKYARKTEVSGSIGVDVMAALMAGRKRAEQHGEQLALPAPDPNRALPDPALKAAETNSDEERRNARARFEAMSTEELKRFVEEKSRDNK
jgi:hypothetical protein